VSEPATASLGPSLFLPRVDQFDFVGGCPHPAGLQVVTHASRVRAPEGTPPTSILQQPPFCFSLWLRPTRALSYRLSALP
jgi:hypothetical protein